MLLVGGHVKDYKDYTTYLSTIKYAFVTLMLLIDVMNGLGIMDGDIINELYTAPCNYIIGS